MRYFQAAITILFIAAAYTASAYDRGDYPHWSDLDGDEPVAARPDPLRGPGRARFAHSTLTCLAHDP